MRRRSFLTLALVSLGGSASSFANPAGRTCDVRPKRRGSLGDEAESTGDDRSVFRRTSKGLQRIDWFSIQTDDLIYCEDYSRDAPGFIAMQFFLRATSGPDPKDVFGKATFKLLTLKEFWRAELRNGV